MRKSSVRALSAVVGVAAAVTVLAAPMANAAADDVIGPNGYSAVSIGMSLHDAQATGEVYQGVGGNDLCRGYNWAYTSFPGVTISTKYGVYSIAAPAGTHTPEGAAVGSTLDQLQGMYPDGYVRVSNGHDVFDTVTPQNPDNHYVFGIRDGKAIAFAVQSIDQHDCLAG